MHTQEVFKILCESDDELLWDDGKVYQALVARKCKMHQPTVKRILDNEHGKVSDDSIEKIANCFGITKAQARGEVDLPGRFNYKKIENYADTGTKTPVQHRVNEKKTPRIKPDAQKAIDTIIDPPKGSEELVKSLIRALNLIPDKEELSRIVNNINQQSSGQRQSLSDK